MLQLCLNYVKLGQESFYSIKPGINMGAGVNKLVKGLSVIVSKQVGIIGALGDILEGMDVRCQSIYSGKDIYQEG